jgi:hypothetical protein
MAEWKKVIVSGSDAELNQLQVSTSVTASEFTGSFVGDGSQLTGVGGAAITYISESGNLSLSEIEVADFDANVAVTYTGGRLKFIFGTPISQSISGFTFGGTFDTNRFNQVLDTYTVTGTWSIGAYTLISASIYEGATIVANTGAGSSVAFTTTTSGSRTYTLHVTASSPLDNSVVVKTATVTGTLAKTAPGAPTITPTPLVQLGAASNQIEQGATGSISFTSASGASNGWVDVFTSTNVASPISVTGSATGSAPISITATSFYSSSGVLGADNSPALTTSTTTTVTYGKIVSVRYGASALTALTLAQLNDLAFWDTTLGGSIGTIAKGTTNPNNYQFTVNTSAQYIYIVIPSTSTLTGILNVNNSNANDLAGAFGGGPIFNNGGYKVYRSINLSTTSILYKLTA